jgi:DNA ligase-1
MQPWNDGEIRVSSNGHKMKFTGGVYSCDCRGWRFQSFPIDKRSCKHLKVENGEAFELARIGAALTAAPAPAAAATSPAATPPSAGNGAAILARAAARIGRSEIDLENEAIVAEIHEAVGSGVLLAETWNDKIDPTNWWMSIKLDGLRSEFTGTEFVSRNGNLFYAPAYFLAGMPQIRLDGELYLGKDMLEDTMSIVRSQNGGDGWKKIRFMIFDAPDHPGSFEERIAYLNKLAADGKFPSHVVIVKHERCKGKQHLLSELDRVTVLNEEGLMLRKPGSKYERRRSSTLLKVKKFFDMEVEIIGHTKGKGKHKGKLGGLVVKMNDGKTFTVGTGLTDKERNNPPQIGCIATITFTTRTKYGIPKCAAYLRVRQSE